MAQLRTYKDIVDAVLETLGVQQSDTTSRNKVKRIVNMVYLDEVVSAKRWKWLEKTTQVVHEAYHAVGTASVTPDSATVTLNTAPNASLGSFKGYRFAADGFGEVYTVSAHTAGSATVTLTSPYQGALNAETKFKIWRDKVDLPVAARETVEMWHSQSTTPVKPLGWQEFRKWEAQNPKNEGYPRYYNTTDFFDPTDSDAESADDHYRQVRIYPSIVSSPITLNIDYTERVTELSLDDDEPVLPLSDRAVIFYGATAQAAFSIHRDPQQFQVYQTKFESKLARMMGEIEDGFDKPNIGVRSGYLASFRQSGLRSRRTGLNNATSSSSYSAPTYAKDITLEGGTITANFAVDDLVTIDGRDISEDGATLDSLTDFTSVTLNDNQSAAETALSVAITEATALFITYTISRGNTHRAGMITLTTDGTATAFIAEGNIAGTAVDPGVTFTADLNSGNLRLRYTSTNTGTAPTFKYRFFDALI